MACQSKFTLALPSKENCDVLLVVAVADPLQD